MIEVCVAGKPKILIVDDEPGIRSLLKYEFSRHGCEIAVAENADQALELLQGNSFDVIITDIRMPGSMDGIDLIDSHRKEHPSQKVIFMTGYAVEEKLAAALQNPLNFCFKKPFDISELTTSALQLIS